MTRILVPASTILCLALAACGGDDDDPTAPPPPPPPGESTLRTAVLQGANGYPTRGSAAIVVDAGAHRLELGDDFETEASSALDVRLCTSEDCSGSHLVVGSLQSPAGRQSYPLPDDGAAFSHVVIWCRAIDLAFGSGELR